MILFKDDWKRFPHAIPDFQTSNKSWVEAAITLREMGVENCLWPLALMQPELQGVDPHDPDLDFETKKKIGVECRWNPWYGFREVIKVPPQSSDLPLPLLANRGNLCLFWCFFNHIDVALEQIRQTGKSINGDSLWINLITMTATNSTFGLFTKDDGLRRVNVERIKKFLEYLPSYIYSPSKNDIDNMSEFSYSLLGNKYKTAVAQKNELAANNAGRGFSMPCQQFDETAFITWIQETMPAALAAGTAVRDEAARFNKPYGNIYTTTSGRRDTPHGKYVYNFFHSAAPWTESLYDSKNQEELYERVLRSCRPREGYDPKLMVHAVFNHRQLGKTDEWLRKKLSESNSTGAKANMDFFNIWESGSEEHPLEQEDIKKIVASQVDPSYQHYDVHSYLLNWYIPKDEIEDYMKANSTVLGLDTSDAIGRDGVGFVLKDIRDMSTVATMSINEALLPRLAQFVARFLLQYKNCTLIIEKKNVAQSFVDTLLIMLPEAGEDPFRRIFNRINDESPRESQEYKDTLGTPLNRRHPEVYEKYKKYFGFNTSGSSRHALYTTVLRSYIRKAAGLIKDKKLIDELTGLSMRNGRVDHTGSGNDDMVISALMCEWLVSNGRNLMTYGIDPLKVKTAEYKEVNELSFEDKLDHFEQESYREEIDEINKKLGSTEDLVQVTLLENRLTKLVSLLKNRDDDFLSLDAMIQNANQEREHRRISRKLRR